MIKFEYTDEELKEICRMYANRAIVYLNAGDTFIYKVKSDIENNDEAWDSIYNEVVKATQRFAKELEPKEEIVGICPYCGSEDIFALGWMDVEAIVNGWEERTIIVDGLRRTYASASDFVYDGNSAGDVELYEDDAYRCRHCGDRFTLPGVARRRA